MEGEAEALSPRGRVSRKRLWLLLCMLVVLTLGTLVFLAREYEESQTLALLERDAAGLAADIRSGLMRNVQSLQTLQGPGADLENWQANAAELLRNRREIVRLEWRDPQLHLIAGRDSPYHPLLFDFMQRPQAVGDVRQACANAVRSSSPAYAPSYFWPIAQGSGEELMEMCLPLATTGQPAGHLIATYSLLGILRELPDPRSLRGRSLAFAEADGTRLAIHGSVSTVRGVIHTTQLLDLPGPAYMLRLEAPRAPSGWLPNVLTAAVATLTLALLAVLGLLAHDMDRRVKAEDDLADALAFRDAMENSLVTGLRARDVAGRITYVNPAFCQMVGLKAEDLLGQGIPAPYWPPELVDEYQQRMDVRLAGRVMPREGFESVFQRADGTRFPVLIIEAPLINAQGQQTGWMSAILDLSEQRRVEELSRASQDRLQATARLAMAGEMASLLSHELNQPLAAIASYASGGLNLLGQPGTHPPDAATLADLQQAMSRIGEQAERAARVIKGVGDLVRRRERAREPVHPRTLFDGILPLLHLQARKLDIRLATELPTDCPQVLCDRTMVEQVLLNLARNGMQAMPEGRPPLRTGLRVLTLKVGIAGGGVADAVPGGRRWLEFSVTDHGEGLSDEVAQRLFTPFFTTKAEGMGLGLSLCRTVIEQHGGALSYGPASPRGTVFRFTLPMAQDLPQPLPTEALPA